MQQYLDILDNVLKNGHERGDRTGTGTYSLFGLQFRHDLAEGFPILTTKKIHWKSVVHELLWFISGSTNVKPLQEAGITIWDAWADQDGELGPVYGSQWRDWVASEFEMDGDDVIPCCDHPMRHDQLQDVLDSLKDDPYGRRHIVSAWNVGALSQMNLPPCHLLFQFYVDEKPGYSGKLAQRLSCHMYQRSADIFLGVPFNIASYALLTHMLALSLDMTPGDLIISFGDIHLYKDHVEQATKQLRRKPGVLPSLSNAAALHNAIKQPDLIRSNFMLNDQLGIHNQKFELVHYHPQPGIKAPISV